MLHFLSLMGFGLLYTCKKQTISVHECAELTNLERDKNITHRVRPYDQTLFFPVSTQKIDWPTDGIIELSPSKRISYGSIYSTTLQREKS